MVTFVGIHYKEGKQALDSGTLSGKKIDKVIAALSVPCLKCNLFQDNHLPSGEERAEQARMFKTFIPDSGVIVLLGGQVQKYFPYKDFMSARIVKFRHPSFSSASFADELLKEINRQ